MISKRVKSLLGAVLVAVHAAHAVAQPASPAPVLPETLQWSSPPGNPALRAVWVLGTEQGAAPYVLRVRLAQGGRIAVHTHPDTRNSTVLSGTLYVGFGETADETRMVAVPTGAVYVAPAHVPHYLWAKDGDVVYQEGGVGPTANISGVAGNSGTAPAAGAASAGNGLQEVGSSATARGILFEAPRSPHVEVEVLLPGDDLDYAWCRVFPESKPESKR